MPATGWHRAGIYVGGTFAAFALSVAWTYFESALVIGAFDRAEGRTPTLRSVLAATWERKWPVLGWALVSSTVGAVLRAIEERVGFGGRLLGVGVTLMAIGIGGLLLLGAMCSAVS